ncbi:MAG: phosphate ABC transporter permease subunit PstC [Chloroflexi bacterium]|nr:phosphate ABC transporter permease subunit PstC [Chloroflexota bacterium]
MAIAARSRPDPDPYALKGNRTRDLGERVIHGLLLACALLSVITTLAIIYVLLEETVGFFQKVSFLDYATGTKWSALIEPRSFGILPLVWGTIMVAGIAGVIAIPIGLGAAVYLSEYADQRVRSILKPTLEILAGVPTIVYGFFAVNWITPHLQDIFGDRVGFFNGLSAGIVVGIMVIPMVSSLSEDAMHAVPQSLREGAYGLGSTKFDVSTRVVIPAALSGIVASFILALSRAVGETMAVVLAAGSTPNLSLDPFQSFQTMTAFIVQVALGDAPTGSIEYQALFAVGMTLFVMTLAMNVVSQLLLARYRDVYQ